MSGENVLTPSAETVLHAIDALYTNPDSKVKEEASKWLSEFQKSVYAWQISDQLLYLKRDLNSCYFGAQTIRIKIQCHFAELPVESHESLKNSLLGHIEKLSCETESPIANQLCLALADLICDMVQWDGAIKDIIQRFTSTNDSLPYLLDILKFIPEEMNSKIMRLGQNRRYAMMAECESHKFVVIKLLEQCIVAHSSDMKMLARIFSCLGSWWDNTAVMAEADIVESPLVDALFAILRQPIATPEPTYDAAAQCLMDIIYHADTSLYPVLLPKLQLGTYELLEVYQQCVPRADLLGRCMCIARVFAELATTLLSSICRAPDPDRTGSFGDLRTIDLLLECTAHRSQELCAITFNALSHFAEEIAKNHNTSVILPTTPYFNRLVVALTQHCRHSEGDADGLEEMREFRNEVFDLMQDILHVIGADNIFNEMMQHMKLMQSSGGANWSDMEAGLFILSTVAKRIDSSDPNNGTLELVGSLLPSISSAPATTQEVVFFLFGELSHWAAFHQQLRKPMVEVLAAAVIAAQEIQPGQLLVSQKAALGAALSALGSLSSVGRQSMIEQHWGELLSVARALPLLPVVLHHENGDFYAGLTRSLVGHHSSHGVERPPVLDLGTKLKEMTGISIECLNKLIDGNVPIEANNSVSDPCVWVDNLAMVFRSLGNAARGHDNEDSKGVILGSAGSGNGVDAYIGVVRDGVWPVVARVLDHYYSRPRVMERTCRVVRFVVRSLGGNVGSMLSAIAAKMVETYSKCQCSCFLYLGSVLVDEFGNMRDCQPGLIQMFEAFAAPTLASLEGDGLAQNPETVEDLFRMVSRLVQRCPRPFMACPTVPLERLGAVAVLVMPVPHTDANMAAGRFLSEMMIYAKEEQELVASQGGDCVVRGRVLNWLESPESQGGAQVVTSVVNACCLHLETDRFSDLADIIYQLRDMVPPERFMTWLDAAIQSLPLYRADGLVHATEKQIDNFRHAIMRSQHSDSLSDALDEFAKLFR